MKMIEVRKRAKAEGVKTHGSKASVIRRIQESEGNEQCFDSKSSCDRIECCWRDDCLSSVQCN